jgi:hypothetical protein
VGGKLDAGKVERDPRHILGAIPPDGFPDGNAAPALELLAEPARVFKKTRSSRPYFLLLSFLFSFGPEIYVEILRPLPVRLVKRILEVSRGFIEALPNILPSPFVLAVSPPYPRKPNDVDHRGMVLDCGFRFAARLGGFRLQLRSFFFQDVDVVLNNWLTQAFSRSFLNARCYTIPPRNEVSAARKTTCVRRRADQHQLALRATMRPLFMLVLLPRVGDAEAIITVR